MKANVEAYQHGEEDGWADGYHDKGYKTSFHYPYVNCTDAEKKNYEIGYNSGWDEGARNS